MEKSEIAHFEQFHLFPQCFHKDFYFNALKCVYKEEWVKKTLIHNHKVKNFFGSVVGKKRRC